MGGGEQTQFNQQDEQQTNQQTNQQTSEPIAPPPLTSPPYENVHSTSPPRENAQPTSPSTVTEASPSTGASDNVQPTSPSTVTGENPSESSGEGGGLKRELVDKNATNENSDTSTVKGEESSHTEPVPPPNDSQGQQPQPESNFSDASSIPKEYQATFEQNAEYCEAIRKEVAEKSPLVCLTEPIDKLYEEYENGSEVFRQKITVG